MEKSDSSDVEKSGGSENGGEEDGQSAFSAPPLSGTFRIPKSSWDDIRSQAKPQPPKHKGDRPGASRKGTQVLQVGAGWRRLLLPPLCRLNPWCNLQGGQANLFIKPDRKSGAYAVAYCKCKRTCGGEDTAEAEKPCDVSYKLSLLTEPDSEDEEVEIVFEQSSGSVWDSHGKSKVSFWKNRLHGPEREKMKEKLRTCNTTVAQFAKESGREAAAESALQTGNLSGVVSEKAAQHMLRELENAGRLHEDSFMELHELQTNWVAEEMEALEESGGDVPGYHIFGFIQGLSLRPFNVLLFSEQSVRLAKGIVHSRNARKPGPVKKSVMHIDASGGVCRGVGKGKDPFLYVLLLRSEKSHLSLSSPFAFMLSDRHDTEAVRHWISTFFSQIAKRCPGDWDWSPTIAVSDMSLPILRAESLALNGLPLYRYIRWCWQVAVEQQCSSAEIKEHTILRVCSFHTLKNFPLTSGKTKDSRKLNHQARIMLGKVLMAENVQRLRGLLESLALVMWSEKYTEAVEAALAEFEALSALPTSLLEELATMESAEEAAALADSVVNIVGAQPLSDSDWDQEKTLKAPSSIHLGQYFEKPPFRDEADEEKRNVEWTGKTQRERSPWYRDLKPYIDRGEQRAQKLDEAAGLVKEANPYHLTSLVRHLRQDFIANAPLLTCIMEEPLRYARDIEEKNKPVVTGLVTPITNNAAEGSFSNIKRLETERDKNVVQVLGRRKGKVRPAVLVRNLYDTHKNNMAAASQDIKTGGQGPLHSIVPNKRKSKKSADDWEDEEDEDKGDEAEEEDIGEANTHKEPGDDAVTEKWSKTSPTKTPPKKNSKFLSPDKKLKTLSSTKKIVIEKRGRTRKKSKSRRKLDLASSSTPSPPSPSFSPRRLRPRTNPAEAGGKAEAAAAAALEAEADAAETRAEAALFHGDNWRRLQETLGSDKKPESDLSLATGTLSESSPPVVIRPSTTVTLDDTDDDGIMLATPMKERTERSRRLRERDRTPETDFTDERFAQLTYVQKHVFPAFPKRFLAGLPPPPERIMAKTAGNPSRTSKPVAAVQRSWDGRYPAPPLHKGSSIVPQIWGVNKPGPVDNKRFYCSDTCTLDAEVALWDRYERSSGGRVSAFFNSIGRKSLAAALMLIGKPSDQHWIGVDDFRREMAALMGVKPGNEGKYALWDSHRNGFLAQFGETAGIAFSLSCACKTTMKRVPMLEVQASPHAKATLQEQLGALLNLDTPYWQVCVECGSGYKKLDVYQANPESFVIGVEIHGGTIGERGDEVATAWLRAVDELPRTLSLPGSRLLKDDTVFALEALILYTNRNHYQMVTMGANGEAAFIVDDITSPHVRPFDASDLLARLAEGLDETREPTVAPTCAYYMKQVDKPISGVGIVPSASFGTSATADTRKHRIPRKFRDQSEDY